MSTHAAFGTLIIDCADPNSLADFYANLLGLKVDERSEDYVTLPGGPIPLAFQRVEGYRAPAWPEENKHTHFDLAVVDVDAAVAELLAAGATRPDFQPGKEDWTVLADPEGHVFCLSAA